MTIVSVRAGSEAADPNAAIDLPWSPGGRIQAQLDDLAVRASAAASTATRDLMTFAVAAYAADKAVLRHLGQDKWTRAIELRVPLIDPDKWPVGASERLLHRLSGDRWTIVPRKAVEETAMWPANGTDAGNFEEVALISGGLDSLAYAAESMAEARSTHFVAHFDPNARKSLQRSLFESVVPTTSPSVLAQFGVQLAGRDPVFGDEKEPSTRARVVIFIAGAVATASMDDVATVAIPENGYVSINVPLGPNRIGSLSTRTTHPMTIALYQQLLDDLSVNVTLAAPYALLTKGEVVARGIAAGLQSDAIASSVSCAHPLQGRWQQEAFGNCGYCYACLVRRASLHATGDDPTTYRKDPRQDMRALGAVGGNDFRSVVTALGRPLRGADALAAGPLPPGTDINVVVEMLHRGREELRGMIDSGLSPAVRASIGW